MQKQLARRFKKHFHPKKNSAYFNFYKNTNKTENWQTTLENKLKRNEMRVKWNQQPSNPFPSSWWASLWRQSGSFAVRCSITVRCLVHHPNKKKQTPPITIPQGYWEAVSTWPGTLCFLLSPCCSFSLLLFFFCIWKSIILIFLHVENFYALRFQSKNHWI